MRERKQERKKEYVCDERQMEIAYTSRGEDGEIKKMKECLAANHSA